MVGRFVACKLSLQAGKAAAVRVVTKLAAGLEVQEVTPSPKVEWNVQERCVRFRHPFSFADAGLVTSRWQVGTSMMKWVRRT